MKSYVRIGGRDLKSPTYPYMVVGGVKNCQNHPYVINEWPLIHYSASVYSIQKCPKNIGNIFILKNHNKTKGNRIPNKMSHVDLPGAKDVGKY